MWSGNLINNVIRNWKILKRPKRQGERAFVLVCLILRVVSSHMAVQSPLCHTDILILAGMQACKPGLQVMNYMSIRSTKNVGAIISVI